MLYVQTVLGEQIVIESDVKMGKSPGNGARGNIESDGCFPRLSEIGICPGRHDKA